MKCSRLYFDAEISIAAKRPRYHVKLVTLYREYRYLEKRPHLVMQRAELVLRRLGVELILQKLLCDFCIAVIKSLCDSVQ